MQVHVDALNACDLEFIALTNHENIFAHGISPK